MKKSTFLSVNVNDFLKGLLMIVITSIVTGFYELLTAGTVLTWDTIKPILLAGVTAGIGYIIKNFLTNSQGQVLTSEPKPLSPPEIKPKQNSATKIIMIAVILSGISVVSSAQLFKPTAPFPSATERTAMVIKGIMPEMQKWEWKLDASIDVVEFNYDKDLKQLVSKEFSAIGPAIGYQHFVPTSDTDPTAFNNYGFSAAFLLGQSIYNPDLAAAKIALQANLMQYFKFGVTYTIRTPTTISHLGVFFGGGITF